jgi:hypothetical protein
LFQQRELLSPSTVVVATHDRLAAPQLAGHAAAVARQVGWPSANLVYLCDSFMTGCHSTT